MIEILIGRPVRILIKVRKRQMDQRRGLETPERIRLIRPLELSRAVGIAVELVLAALVILEQDLPRADHVVPDVKLTADQP